MQYENSSPQRRVSDVVKEPTLFDILEKLTQIQQRQIDHSTAFLVNDLGKPDYEGHRQAHKALVKAAEALDGYKTDATKKVIGLVLGVVGTLFALGVMSWIQRGGQ